MLRENMASPVKQQAQYNAVIVSLQGQICEKNVTKQGQFLLAGQKHWTI
jgi:hypothetical protein